MNSITIATKTTRMGIRLHTAVSQASKRGSNPQALAVGMVTRTGAGGGWEDTALSYPAPPFTCTSLGSSELSPAKEQTPIRAGSWRGLEGVWGFELLAGLASRFLPDCVLQGVSASAPPRTAIPKSRGSGLRLDSRPSSANHPEQMAGFLCALGFSTDTRR